MSNFNFHTTSELLEMCEQDLPHTEISRHLAAATHHARIGKAEEGTKTIKLVSDGAVCCIAKPHGDVELAFRDYPSVTFTAEQLSAVAMMLRLEHAASLGCPEREAGDPIALGEEF